MNLEWIGEAEIVRLSGRSRRQVQVAYDELFGHGNGQPRSVPRRYRDLWVAATHRPEHIRRFLPQLLMECEKHQLRLARWCAVLSRIPIPSQHIVDRSPDVSLRFTEVANLVGGLVGKVAMKEPIIELIEDVFGFDMEDAGLDWWCRLHLEPQQFAGWARFDQLARQSNRTVGELVQVYVRFYGDVHQGEPPFVLSHARGQLLLILIDGVSALRRQLRLLWEVKLFYEAELVPVDLHFNRIVQELDQHRRTHRHSESEHLEIRVWWNEFKGWLHWGLRCYQIREAQR